MSKSLEVRQKCSHPAANFKDLTGKRFGRLVAQWPVGKDTPGHGGQVRWLCLCDCGELNTATSSSLNIGRIKSCGCLSRDRARETNTTHGKTNTIEYALLHGARRRAKSEGLPYNLELEDIVIPEKCPLLEIPLSKSKTTKPHANSPSLDKIIPARGYVKGNFQIISWRANRIKCDASLEEFELIAKNWRKQCL